MAASLADKVLGAVHHAKELYHRLVLAVAPSGSGKTEALRDVAERTGARLINLNLELSSRMLDLLNNLKGPTTCDQLELLGPEQRELVEAFIASGTLPDGASRDFIDAVAQVLSGLSKVVVTAEELCQALFPSGSPATPGQLKKRFGDYVDERAKGMDEAKARIVIE